MTDEELTPQEVARGLEIGMLGKAGMRITAKELRILLAERRELLARQSENAEIIAVHDKIQAGRLGMHPLIAAMCQVAAGATMDEAMRDIGYVVARQVPDDSIAIPKKALRWLFGMGDECFDWPAGTELRLDGTPKARFWWRSAFADRAGISDYRVLSAPSPTATDVSQYSKPDQAPGEDGMPYG